MLQYQYLETTVRVKRNDGLHRLHQSRGQMNAECHHVSAIFNIVATLAPNYKRPVKSATWIYVGGAANVIDTRPPTTATAQPPRPRSFSSERSPRVTSIIVASSESTAFAAARIEMYPRKEYTPGR